MTIQPGAKARVRAPELTGAGGWIGVDALSLADLRGRIVILDFWTLCCVNCLAVVEELRALERRFADTLVVIGVHSPKFAHEHDHEAVRLAVARHRIEHPVLDDPDLRTWDAYAVRAWPTIVLVDTEGRVALHISGEGHAEGLAVAIEALIAEGEARGTLRRGALPAAGDLDGEPMPVEIAGTGELAFPGKVAVDAAGERLAVADTGHDRVLVTALSGEVLEEFDGLYMPQGVRFDGNALLVCEQGAGRVWRLFLAAGGRRELVAEDLASPWDVVRWRGHVVIAEAGRHRLWAIDGDGDLQVIAGSGAENLLDGPSLHTLLAQPSGLTVTADGDLAFADAESSALRVLTRDGFVETLVGHGLFAWGEADGDREHALLQHPLGVAAAPDGALYVADTFNSLLRVWRGTHLWTIPLEGFDEPGGLDVLPDGRVVVADTGNHRIVLVDPVAGAGVTVDVGRPSSLDVVGVEPLAVAETVVGVAGSTLEVDVDLDLGGDLLDPMGGPPVQVLATASDPGLLRGETVWRLDALPARVELELGEGSGRITVEVRAATCDGAACRLRRTQRAYDVILAR